MAEEENTAEAGSDGETPAAYQSAATQPATQTAANQIAAPQSAVNQTAATTLTTPPPAAYQTQTAAAQTVMNTQIGGMAARQITQVQPDVTQTATVIKKNKNGKKVSPILNALRIQIHNIITEETTDREMLQLKKKHKLLKEFYITFMILALVSTIIVIGDIGAVILTLIMIIFTFGLVLAFTDFNAIISKVNDIEYSIGSLNTYITVFFALCIIVSVILGTQLSRNERQIMDRYDKMVKEGKTKAYVKQKK
jgi:hypothetical protein